MTDWTHFKNTGRTRTLCQEKGMRQQENLRFFSSHTLLVTCPDCLWALKQK